VVGLGILLCLLLALILDGVDHGGQPVADAVANGGGRAQHRRRESVPEPPRVRNGRGGRMNGMVDLLSGQHALVGEDGIPTGCWSTWATRSPPCCSSS
jgi:predicted NBD/HSP70 family sugar kinase